MCSNYFYEVKVIATHTYLIKMVATPTYLIKIIATHTYLVKIIATHTYPVLKEEKSSALAIVGFYGYQQSIVIGMASLYHAARWVAGSSKTPKWSGI